VFYTKYNNVKGLTLIKEQPVFFYLNNSMSDDYNNEKVISISAGVDGALWALLYEDGVTDYTVAKWQTIVKKWYRVPNKKGINLSAFNEISLALVDSIGLVSLSSSENN